MNKPIPLRLTKESDEDKSNYYNREAATIRRTFIEHQVKMYVASGGKITKLPAYDEAAR